MKKLLISAAVIAGVMAMVAEPVLAQRGPPRGPGWRGPNFTIRIGPPVRRWAPPPRIYRRPPPPPPRIYRRAPGYCNVRACAASYRSFRAWDCTYQPYYGPRRLCTIP